MVAEEYELVEPRAESISESLRAFGYTFEAAVADLVDNSVSARSRNIDIRFNWNDGDPFLWVLDDGKGMDAGGLREAMRPGSHSPRGDREPHDLGRFGLGLKTASFSQCRRITVRSRHRSGSDETRVWDLDVIQEHNEWRLLKSPSTRIGSALGDVDDLASGTVVVWEDLDRWQFTEGQEDATYEHFAVKINDVARHLAMTFHRFLTGPQAVKMTIGGTAIHPWDPFLSAEKPTQELSSEDLPLAGRSIHVQPYVLPHVSMIDGAKHREASGPRGWNAQQGFYIYRNRRLIIAGDWLGLGYQQEEHHKLARIRVDLPNNLDSHWQLDVRKATAIPPPGLRGDLKRIADATRRQAAKVYRHRGKEVRRSNSTTVDVVWKQVRKRAGTVFRVNRQHLVVREIIGETGSAGRDLVELLESTLPVDAIVVANAENPDSLDQAADMESTRSLEDRALAILKMYVDRGSTPPNALAAVAAIEPFDRSPRLLARAEAYVERLEMRA